MPRVPVLLVVAGLVLSGCTLEVTTDSAADPPAATVPAARSLTPSEAKDQLDDLAVARRERRDDYDRDAFGSAWADTDGNGCNQRDDVLLRDAEPGTTTVARQGRCDHDVLAGTWVDPYTGSRIVLTDLKDPAQAQALQIDHVVPLAEAWSSGASAWRESRRRAYANDLDGLLAVDGPTNASKSDDDPAAWRPRQAYQCEYAVRWVATKSRWELAIDRSERRALLEMLATC